MSITLAAVIMARNEEHNIRDCIASVQWADSVTVILDPRNADRTAEFAAAAGATVIEMSSRTTLSSAMTLCDW